MQELDRSYSHFPLWLEKSGLPAFLNEKAKSPFTWIVFRKIVELDLAEHPARPGIVEISLAAIGEATGLDTAKVEKSIKAIRKAGLVRAFVPENPEEPGCYQLITPLPTPITADEVRARHPDLFLESVWPPRYAVEVKEDSAEALESRAGKIKRVVDLYLNSFSMRMNSLIIDELQIIADRYDMELIEKVFQQAKKKEVRSLGWVVTEIRREIAYKQKADELRAAAKGS